MIFDILLWVVIAISIYISIWWLIALNKTLAESKTFSYDEAEAYLKTRIKSLPKVSVTVPLWNEEKTIFATINSVLDLKYPKDKLELIIINDGSKDNSEEEIFKAIPELRKVKSEEKTIKTIVGVKRKIFLREIITKSKVNVKYVFQPNSGKGVGLNVAITISDGDYFAALDADSFVESETLMKMLATFYHCNDKLGTDRVITITPAMRIKNPKTTIEYFQHYEYLMSMFVARIMSEHDMIYVAPGPFSLYNKRKIVELGGCHENQRQILTEDQELAYRVQDNQYLIKQCPNGYVYTTGMPTLKKLLWQRNRWFKGSIICFYMYRHMFFNKKYGDFGYQQMAINGLRVFLALAALYIFYELTIHPVLKIVHKMSLYSFDFWPFLEDLLKLDFDILGLNYARLVASLIILFIGLILLILSFINANTKIERKDLKYIAVYFFLYHILMSYVMLRVVIDLLIGKKQWW